MIAVMCCKMDIVIAAIDNMYTYTEPVVVQSVYSSTPWDLTKWLLYGGYWSMQRTLYMDVIVLSSVAF